LRVKQPCSIEAKSSEDENEDEDEEVGTVVLLMTSMPKNQSQELQQRRTNRKTP
jgi:hypothetical protein